MEIEVKIKIAMPDEVAENLGIDEDSVLESYDEDGYIYIRKIDDDELDELAHEHENCTDCESCEMFCPHCQSCILDD